MRPDGTLDEAHARAPHARAVTSAPCSHNMCSTSISSTTSAMCSAVSPAHRIPGGRAGLTVLLAAGVLAGWRPLSCSLSRQAASAALRALAAGAHIRPRGLAGRRVAAADGKWIGRVRSSAVEERAFVRARLVAVFDPLLQWRVDERLPKHLHEVPGHRLRARHRFSKISSHEEAGVAPQAVAKGLYLDTCDSVWLGACAPCPPRFCHAGGERGAEHSRRTSPCGTHLCLVPRASPPAKVAATRAPPFRWAAPAKPAHQSQQHFRGWARLAEA